MSGQKRRSHKVLRDIKNNTKIEDYFPQVLKEEQNNSNISQMKVGSRKRPRDITNTQDRGRSLPKKTPEDQAMPQNKTINVTLSVNHRKNQNMKYVLTYPERASLQEALSTLQAVKEEVKAQQGKEMLVRGTGGIAGYLNLGMPLVCLPEESQVEITFSKSGGEQKEDNRVFSWQDKASTDCVKFYIQAVGKTRRRIVKCGELHKEGNKLCVFGFKGETIKDVLCKDGRFLSFLENERWKLIRDLVSIRESTQVVDEIEGKLFQLEVIKKKSTRGPATAEATQNAELEKNNARVLPEYIVEEYPSLKREVKEVREHFKKEMGIRRMNRSSLFKLHKENFGKLTKTSTPVKIHKLLSGLSNSVGYLYWDNNGNRGSATCFVFAKSFIFTCRHVINQIVGEGVEPSKWAGIIGQSVWVTFNYEDHPVEGDSRFFVEPWFEISEVTLDYAVLQLKENEQPPPMGLYNGIAPVPCNGVIYIIGHPGGDRKSTDHCVVIPQSERGESCDRHIRDLGPEFVHMYSQRSFQDVLYNPDVLTYDTTFYWGSSGSPVFDSNGSLVAIHTAGIIDKSLGRDIHVIEYGCSMRAILSNITQNHKEWYENEFVNQEDVEMLSQEF